MVFRSSPLAAFGFPGPAAAAGPAAPTLVQHVASSANPSGIGISEDNFLMPLPNPTGAGNCLVLCITYPHGNTPTVSDTNGNSWPGSPAVSADGGSGNYVSAIFVLPNANAGQTAVKVAFGALVIPFQYDLSEFNNIATSSPVNTTASTAITASSSNTLSAGSVTGVNGNLVLTYHCVGAGAGGNPTTWAAGGSFALIEADNAWTSGQGVPHASQWQIASSSSVTCSIGETGDTASLYNSVAVALKVASAGAPAASGIYINKILHFTNQSIPNSLAIQTPVVGNLMVITTTNPNVSAVSDSDGGSWTLLNSVGGACLFYSVNRTGNLNRKVTFTSTGNAPTSFRVYDISGAAAAPFDVSATLGSTGLNGATSISNAPSITPTTTNGLVIAALQLGQGPGYAITSPAGAIFDLVTMVTTFSGSVSGSVLTAGAPGQGTLEVGMNVFGTGIIRPPSTATTIASLGTGTGGAGTYNLNQSQGTIGTEPMTCGQTDQDLMENADGNAHYYNATTSAINFNWTITNQPSNSGTAVAAAFKHA